MNTIPNPNANIIIILYLHMIFCKQLYGRLVFILFDGRECFVRSFVRWYVVSFNFLSVLPKLNVSHISWYTRTMLNWDTWLQRWFYFCTQTMLSLWMRKKWLSTVGGWCCVICGCCCWCISYTAMLSYNLLSQYIIIHKIRCMKNTNNGPIRERIHPKIKLDLFRMCLFACIRIVLIFIFAGFRFDFAFFFYSMASILNLRLFCRCSYWMRKERRGKKKEFIFLIFMSVVK